MTTLSRWVSYLLFALALAGGCASSGASESGAMAETTPADETAAPGDAMAKSDIVDTAVAAGNFDTLVAAVQAAGLVDTLKSEGPFTVFAPTDEAFAALPEGTLESLLLPENRDKLTKILTYHVVSGDVRAEQVVSMNSAKTVEGQDLPIKVTGDQVTVGQASVVKTDIECSNGVIHVIDAVLLPAD